MTFIQDSSVLPSRASDANRQRRHEADPDF